MSANNFNAQSQLGVGLGLRVPHYAHILSKKPTAAWFEIISENFMVDGGRPREVLEKILEQYKVIMHGVSLYIGSADKINREHLKKLKALARLTNTPWLSDHLCWGSVDGSYSHDLLPTPYTPESVKRCVDKIRHIQDYLGIPLAIENISSYAEFNSSTMTEWDFLTEVVEKADCGILLDVNNIYVSSQNHDFDPYEYLSRIPLKRVAQIHIAGHSRFERFIIDTHDSPVVDPVWNLYASVIDRIGRTPTLLEWDAKIPPFEEVYREASKANRWLGKFKTNQGDTGEKS